MTVLYTDPRFVDHKTGRHPEQPARLTRIVEHLEQKQLPQRCRRVDWQPASIERLGRVHAADHIDHVRQYAERGGGQIEADTVVSPASYDVARLAAGAACDAVERVVRGEDTTALCLVRPPGHHAIERSAMGFCLFNHIAVAARVAIDELGLDRVLIVDWDVHHGNGTQDAFWTDEQVGFLSIHRWPFYPGTGDSMETGGGAGLGTTLNLPITFGTPRREYLRHFTEELERFADKLRPQLVLLSAGFDSHARDPIGSLGLEVEDFTTLTAVVRQVAATHAEGKLVSLLEGGYNLDVLPDCVAVHLEGLLLEQLK